MTKTRWTTGALAVLAAVGLTLGVAPVANAAGTTTRGLLCNGNTVGVTVKGTSGGNSASTSVTLTACTTKLGVKAFYRRDASGQTSETDWKYTLTAGIDVVTTSPGGVINGAHAYWKSGSPGEYRLTT